MVESTQSHACLHSHCSLSASSEHAPVERSPQVDDFDFFSKKSNNANEDYNQLIFEESQFGFHASWHKADLEMWDSF